MRAHTGGLTSFSPSVLSQWGRWDRSVCCHSSARGLLHALLHSLFCVRGDTGTLPPLTYMKLHNSYSAWTQTVTVVAHSLTFFFLSFNRSADPAGQDGSVTSSWLVKDSVISVVIPRLRPEPSDLLLPSGLPGGGARPAVDQKETIIRARPHCYHNTRKHMRGFTFIVRRRTQQRAAFNNCIVSHLYVLTGLLLVFLNFRGGTNFICCFVLSFKPVWYKFKLLHVVFVAVIKFST